MCRHNNWKNFCGSTKINENHKVLCFKTSMMYSMLLHYTYMWWLNTQQNWSCNSILQDLYIFARKRPFLSYLAGSCRNLAGITCKMLAKFLQDFCMIRILARSCKMQEKRTFSCKMVSTGYGKTEVNCYILVIQFTM